MIWYRNVIYNSCRILSISPSSLKACRHQQWIHYTEKNGKEGQATSPRYEKNIESNESLPDAQYLCHIESDGHNGGIRLLHFTLLGGNEKKMTLGLEKVTDSVQMGTSP